VDATFHESDEKLELYALERLPDSEVIRMEEHLLVCDTCRDRLEDNATFALGMRDALREAGQTASARGFSAEKSGWFGWLRQPQFAYAGALAVALLAVVLIWQGGKSSVPALASLQLTAMRGEVVPVVSPTQQLDLNLSGVNEAVAPLVEVADAKAGGVVWSGTPVVSGGTARVKVSKVLAAGDYVARYYDAPGHLEHEYEFRVK
jgi:hypothetical protein